MSSVELMKYGRADTFVPSFRLVRYLGGSPLASYSPLGSLGRGSCALAPPDVKYIHTHTQYSQLSALEGDQEKLLVLLSPPYQLPALELGTHPVLARVILWKHDP
jgi:hypothetical protein